MKNKLLFFLSAMLFAFFIGQAPATAKGTNADALVQQAEKYSEQLKRYIYVEYAKKIVAVPPQLLNNTAKTIQQAKTATAKTKGTKRAKLFARLKAVDTMYSRAVTYNNAVRIGTSLKDKTNRLTVSFKQNPASDQMESMYVSVQTELKNFDSAYQRVYGAPTRTALYRTYRAPAEQAINQTKTAYALKMEFNKLRQAIRYSKSEATIFNQIDKFEARLMGVKTNRPLFTAFSNSYEDVLKAQGTSQGISTLILKKIIAQEKSVLFLEMFNEANEPIAQASGFVVGKSTILTNFHVVQGAAKIVAYDENGNEIPIRGVVQYDETTDLALLATKTDLALPALKIGDTSLLEKGDPIVTISSPEGLMNTVSTGIISNLHLMEDESGNEVRLIQITAPITHGSSGGALFNEFGHVIGVTSSGFDVENINFAVDIVHAAHWISFYKEKTAASLTVIPYQLLPAPQDGNTPPSETGSTIPTTGTTTSPPTMPISTSKLYLDFQAVETVMHPTKPILYALDGNKNVVEVNLETKTAKKISLPLAPERLYFANNELYVTLPKNEHSGTWWEDQQEGAFAIIDAETFSLKAVVDIPLDPWDIVADSQYIYISSGSGQWTYLKVYSRQTLLEVARVYGIYQQSFLAMHPDGGKVYAITTGLSPRDVETYVFNDGKMVSHYDSPYHGDYNLNTNMTISPDGQFLFNGSGVIWQAAAGQKFDMTYVTTLYNSYQHIAFYLAKNVFYTSKGKTIDVYDYTTFQRVKSYPWNQELQKLYVQNNQLITLYKEGARYVVQTYPLNEQGMLIYQ
ncbi:trypsin-like peptidase domain-containing protein [Anoxybacillus sp. J5B_2022]|uniref:trypsin-like peptidase domain-containing protein n=1 Tax=Anoxybacillus sp. J5B_2022 TaxID=3003246 RepID=UPI0022867D21|nr:trypsin-like peptidase domain-containing protein [Anoxybacillus sp. J5B_2022]MCZ0755201.1 trypsin-like peptidase domain-containing protein [Anoxybacillus sp. J5B_2022]